MIIVKHVAEDPLYIYTVNHYQGMYALDYLIDQLSVWIKNDYEEFNLVLTGSSFDMLLDEGEFIPKLLRRYVEVSDMSWLTVDCYSLAHPHPENNPQLNGSGAVPLWYDIIELPNKRAERSLVRLLDKYCYRKQTERKEKKKKKEEGKGTEERKRKTGTTTNKRKRGHGRRHTNRKT